MPKQLHLALQPAAEPMFPKKKPSRYPMFDKQRKDCSGVHLGDADSTHWHPGGAFGQRPRAKSYIRMRTEAGCPNEIPGEVDI